ncbi:aromatic amino acid DMT transporter YddG [Oxalobacter aliiformigenes]|uniref:aromatic amino acid DMT transporter YddG n=1 Tax=Oxalobacter aliiformigenes TaxID=2946593 RepID=UPI0022AEAE5E|nr:aromatic amino acid DMT transporter YddG [Oxalobacter aliiformigenes]MCZ4064959.1 aromatic amino acid DMT transporter YddG [Oxalobacter aliiformigenes]WAW00140.1 aromatic amino acid DMT transporter YddG [Oxalobacter aliiformigenes]
MTDTTKRNATLTGLCAIFLWSTMVGLIRGITDALGPVGGAAMIYTGGSVMLLATIGFPRLGAFDRRYLVAGSVLFAVYEMLLSLSLGFAQNSRQAIEISMMNYLWPSLTVLFAVFFNRQKAGLLLIPGLALAVAGVCRVLGGETGADIAGILANVENNPLCYGMALAGAFIWATYCTVTHRMAAGQNGITFFFLLTALSLWALYFLTEQPSMHFGLRPALCLLGASAALGFGAAAWNTGMLKGHVTLLATASYFTPVFSSLMTSFLLSTPLSGPFWQGALMVCGGSLLCWISTRRQSD